LIWSLVKHYRAATRLRTNIRRYEFLNDSDSIFEEEEEEEDEGVSDTGVRARDNNNNNNVRDTSTNQQVPNGTMQIDSTGRNHDREQLEKCKNCH